MKSLIALITILSLLNCSNINAQESSQDTTQFKLLRKDLILDIKKHASELLVKDTVKGKIEYLKDGEPYGMGYKIFLSKKALTIRFYEYKRCKGCFNNSDLRINFSTVPYMYVCEDKRHKPKHTSKSRKKILELKKQYNCSGVTLEIIATK